MIGACHLLPGYAPTVARREAPAEDAPAPRKHNAVVAAATRVRLDDTKLAGKQAARRQDWQEEAWDYFDDVPEIKFTTWFFGNAMAKLQLFVAVRPEGGGDPIPVSDARSGVSPIVAARAQAELDRLKGPLGGKPELLRALSMNLEIAGEAYLVGLGPREVTTRDPLTGMDVIQVSDEAWSIKSVSEVSQQNGVYKVTEAPGAESSKGIELDPELDTIIRIWQRHPRYSLLPDCNMRGVLGECEALVLLSNQVKAEAKSRASAGIFTLPNELSFGPTDTTEPVDGDDKGDPFSEEFTDALTEPIEDPASAASVVPLLLRGPAEFLSDQYLRHITFSRDGSAELEARITARIERVARGLNAPVEVVMGHQSTTFANAAQIDEDTYEDHLEPRCDLLADAFTVGYLHPQLLDGGLDEVIVEPLFIWYDPSALIGKTDPKDSADVGVDKGMISEEAWRRVMGWTEEDAPDALEQLIRSGLRRGILTADLTKTLLEMLGVPIDVVPIPKAAAPDEETPAEPAEAAAFIELARMLIERGEPEEPRRAVTASARGGPDTAGKKAGRKLAALDRSLRDRLLVAADRAMHRALERAGNRIKARQGVHRELVRQVPPRYAAATLGPSLTAAAGFTDEELIGDEAWSALEAQWYAWGAQSQQEALNIASALTGFTVEERTALGLRQAADLQEGWDWFKEALTARSHDLLFDPDPVGITAGEFDPNSTVPTGLVREAVARAGGADGIQSLGEGGAWVSVKNGGEPLGGIGTGDLLMNAMTRGGGMVEAYEWDYGSAFRAHPFEEHEALDGLIFANFDDNSLGNTASWLPTTSYFPGDHAGCACDFIPILVAADDVGQTTQPVND